MSLNYFDTVTLADIEKTAKVILSSVQTKEKFLSGSSNVLAILTNSKTGQTVDVFQTFDTVEFLESLANHGFNWGIAQEIGSQEAIFEVYSDESTKKVTCPVIAPTDAEDFGRMIFNPESAEVNFLRKIDEKEYALANLEHMEGWDVDHTERWSYKSYDSSVLPSNHQSDFIRMIREFFSESR